MVRKRYTEEQTIAVLSEAEAGSNRPSVLATSKNGTL